MSKHFETQSAFKTYKMNQQIQQLENQIRRWLMFFILALIISGVTAMPVEAELNFFLKNFPAVQPISGLFTKVLAAVKLTNQTYPFLLYGYDWLAFAHFVIAIAFIGPVREPLKNIWVIEFGMLACVLIIPFALIAGASRSVPLFWRLIDCSFGIIGFIPLWIVRNKIVQIRKIYNYEKQNLIF